MRSEDRPGGPSVRIERSVEPEPGGRSLADLFVRQVPRAVAIAYLMTGDRALAEDLAQEAFVRLAGRFRHIRSRPEVGGGRSHRCQPQSRCVPAAVGASAATMVSLPRPP